ncbi:hypothetical protein O181_090373 [Austropuccinia psidii MF-1]|uniref:Uncharacterized protein n=1 Tax=Austropuccinia psidii MF-1 TaxID=1389203 RepID=A0A9Q3IUY2_9BASI|nr:hypothetical protein [Austropuccinia psidii MF-1]
MANTKHTAERFWALQPEIHPPPRNRNKRGGVEAESHQAGMEALLTNSSTSEKNSNFLVIDCGATHHIFNTKGIFIEFTSTKNKKIHTSDPLNNLISRGCVSQPWQL